MQPTIEAVIAGGPSKLHIITDFDRTLTQAYADGAYKSSLISVLYREGYLSDHCQQTAQGYFDHYHPIEMDETLPLDDRHRAMHQWWMQHMKLLIAEGITRQHIYDAMQTHGVVLRSGVQDFFKLCAQRQIPIIIFSASGLGTVAIERFLQKDDLLTPNIHIVSNGFVWDADGRAIDFHRPLIHSLNKGEIVLSEFDFADELADRPNILLMGDSVGDAAMADGSDYDHIFKIGFLNKDVEKKRALYQEHFNIVIENDGPMDTINELLVQISEQTE